MTEVSPQQSQSGSTQLKHQRSKRFCHKDANLWLLVEDTVYGLHRGILERRSEIWENILSMNGTGGDTEHSPIVLELMAKADFEFLIEYVYDGIQTPEPYDAAMLIAILKLGTFYEMKAERNWAIHHITKDDFIDAATKIDLARKYNVPQWVRPAFEELVYIRPIKLKKEVVNTLGLYTYDVLMKVQDLIRLERDSLAIAAPTLVEHDSCQAHHQCTAAWKEFWWTVLGRHIHHPHYVARLRDLYSWIASEGDIPGVTFGCQEMTMEKLWAENRPAEKEAKYINDAIESVLRFHGHSAGADPQVQTVS